jgi:hypothetical protein
LRLWPGRVVDGCLGGLRTAHLVYDRLTVRGVLAVDFFEAEALPHRPTSRLLHCCCGGTGVQMFGPRSWLLFSCPGTFYMSLAETVRKWTHMDTACELLIRSQPPGLEYAYSTTLNTLQLLTNPASDQLETQLHFHCFFISCQIETYCHKMECFIRVIAQGISIGTIQ